MATSFGLGDEPVIIGEDIYTQEDVQKAVRGAGYLGTPSYTQEDVQRAVMDAGYLDAPPEFSQQGAIAQLEADLMNDIMVRDQLREEELLGQQNVKALDNEEKDFNFKVLEHIKDREGFRNKTYKDSLGKLTAGTGHLLSKEEQKKYPLGTKIPQNILDGWLEEDSNTAKEAARKQVAQITNLKDRRDLEAALVSVNFQLGKNWTKKFPTAWKHLKKGEWEEAISEIEFTSKNSKKESEWKKQTPVRVKDFVSAIRRQYI